MISTDQELFDLGYLPLFYIYVYVYIYIYIYICTYIHIIDWSIFFPSLVLTSMLALYGLFAHYARAHAHVKNKDYHANKYSDRVKWHPHEYTSLHTDTHDMLT